MNFRQFIFILNLTDTIQPKLTLFHVLECIMQKMTCSKRLLYTSKGRNKFNQKKLSGRL